MRTRRSPPGPDPSFAVKSALQKSRDKIASRISKSWLNRGHEGHQGARGIVRPYMYCYLNSALQAFMHQPIFLNWIQTHNYRVRRGRGYKILNPCNPHPPAYMAGTGGGVPDCTACALKGLVNAYWANTSVTIPIPFPGPYTNRIENIAIESGLFQRGVQDDTRQFYDLLLERTNVGSANPSWTEEFHTLYTLTQSDVRQCLTCHHRYRSTVQQNTPGLLLSFNQVTLHCPGACGANTNQTVNTQIVAAPQVLKVTMAIFIHEPKGPKEKDGRQRVREVKLQHSHQHADILDLTNRQMHSSLSLRYRLSSVISHEGNGADAGHYITSVRGQDGRTQVISDHKTQDFTEADFLSSPQVPSIVWPGGIFQVYVLTYLRENGQLTKGQREAAGLVSEMM